MMNIINAPLSFFLLAMVAVPSHVEASVSAEAVGKNASSVFLAPKEESVFCKKGQSLGMQLISTCKEHPVKLSEVQCVFFSWPECSAEDICGFRKGCGYLPTSRF